MTKAYARSVGIAVDHRRRNASEESLELNKQRLLAYVAKLVVLPKGADAKDLKQVSVSQTFPLSAEAALEAARKPTEEEKKASAYMTLRKAWGVQRYAGIRAKRAAEAAEKKEK